jgi:hypothetical protein
MAKVTYLEQHNDPEPGKIVIDPLDILLTGLSNDSGPDAPYPEIILSGTGQLMGKGPLRAEIRFPLQSDTLPVRMTGGAGPIDLTLINPMLTRVTTAAVRAGIADTLIVDSIAFGPVFSTGTVVFGYHGLNIALKPSKKGAWPAITTALVQFVVNNYLTENLAKKRPDGRTGYVYRERDFAKGFFNYLWQSVLSGIKSAAGVNSKEQTNLKKEIRHEEKGRSAGK